MPNIRVSQEISERGRHSYSATDLAHPWDHNTTFFLDFGVVFLNRVVSRHSVQVDMGLFSMNGQTGPNWPKYAPFTIPKGLGAFLGEVLFWQDLGPKRAQVAPLRARVGL